MPTPAQSFKSMLTGGHPNSLGNTVEVVNQVLRIPSRLEELYQCYFSEDEVVRLRTSNALKRIGTEQPRCLVPYLDRLLTEVTAVNQASAQWTLAQLWGELKPFMTEVQLNQAREHLQHNLTNHRDWIVLNNSMQTLSNWAQEDTTLEEWLLPRLKELTGDSRKSVAGRARKLLKQHER